MDIKNWITRLNDTVIKEDSLKAELKQVTENIEQLTIKKKKYLLNRLRANNEQKSYLLSMCPNEFIKFNNVFYKLFKLIKEK